MKRIHKIAWSQVLIWGNTYFLIQMKKLTVCKEDIRKFKAINSSDTVLFFPNYKWHNKDFIFFIKHS